MSTYTDLAEQFRQHIKGEVLSDSPTLTAYQHDASIFELTPQLVVRPRDSVDVQEVVRIVAAAKRQHPELSLTARSAGTDMGGGSLTDSIIVDFVAHLNTMGSVGIAEAVVEPGVYYRDFEQSTLAHDLLLPSYPASREICTVGGMVSNNSGGEKSLSYGKTANYVEELGLILSDGSSCVAHALTAQELATKMALDTFEGHIYRELHDLIERNRNVIAKAKPHVTKNSCGYDLWDVWDGKRFDLTKLIVGSQGTLAFVSKIKFRLIKPKPISQLLVIFLSELTHLGEIVGTVMEYHPESFELYDDHTFKLAVRFMPDMIRRMKGNAVVLGLKFLPELWMTIRGGVPKLILIAEFTGKDASEVERQLHQAQTAVTERFHVPTRLARRPSDAQKYWVVRRESFNLLRQHTSGLQTAPFIDDIVVRPEQLPEFLPRLNAILERYPTLVYTIAGHAGDANFHIIPLMDLKREEDRAIIPALSEQVYDLVLEFGGSITGEHNDGLIRTPYVEKMFGPEMYRLFQTTKRIFDPDGIFNPRKKVNGDLNFAMGHIRRD